MNLPNNARETLYIDIEHIYYVHNTQHCVAECKYIKKEQLYMEKTWVNVKKF